MNTKRTIYIAAFTFLGILVSFLVHGLIEIPYTTLLLKNFERWGLGLSWETWFWIHHVGAVLLFLAGLLFGYRQGQHWWQVIYGRVSGRSEERQRKPKSVSRKDKGSPDGEISVNVNNGTG